MLLELCVCECVYVCEREPKTLFLNRGADVQQGFGPHSVCQHLALLCAWSAMSPSKFFVFWAALQFLYKNTFGIFHYIAL